MNKFFNTILETIGHTPLVKINKLAPANATLFAKVESFNPASSIKDRVGLALIEEAEKNGTLKPNSLIIEPTSGNTGIGLAMAAAVKNYRLILTMPDSMSIERQRLLKAYGAELVLTPGSEGMSGAIAKAEEIARQNPNSFIPQQFSNPANPAIHYQTTGPEIWEDTNGEIKALVACVGTGGTLSGIAKFLKEKNPEIKIIAVEPAESPLLSKGFAAPHRIQGIGANFIPDNLDTTLIDEIIPVTADEAGKFARQAATQEGLLIGISGGAALAAALNLVNRPEFAQQPIVAILPDSGERYLSSWLFND